MVMTLARAQHPYRLLAARSAVVTTMAAPESVTRQQSTRWKGQETQRELW